MDNGAFFTSAKFTTIPPLEPISRYLMLLRATQFGVAIME
jgi:hypothetical protein